MKSQLARVTLGTFMCVWFGAASMNILFLSSDAMAGQGPKTACFSFPTDKFSVKSASTLGHLLRDNFIRSNKFDVIDVRALINKGSQDARLTTLENAREMLKKGKEQYENLELDAAIDDLEKAKSLFIEAVGRLGDGEDYMDTLLYLGASRVLSGDNEQGLDAFRLVAMFDRRKVLDPKMFPPSMIEMFNRARASVTTAPVGMVQMKSNPPAAEVYLNGVYKGVTPLNLVKIPEGKHFIRVEMDGYLPWGKVVDFYATHEARVEATLRPSKDLEQFKKRTKNLTSDLDDDSPKPELVKFGQWLGVDRLVVASVRQRKSDVNAEAVMIQVEPPKVLSYKSISLNMTKPSFIPRADAFFTSLYRKVKIPSGNAIHKKKDTIQSSIASCNSDSDCAIGEVCDSASGTCIPETPEGEKIYEKWWFWTIVGGVAVVGAGAGVLTWYLLQPEQGAIEFSF